MIDARLESLARRYKASVAGRYRAIRPADLEQIPHAPCFVSRKIDGELWFAQLDRESASLFALGGRQIEEGPVVDALKAIARDCRQPLVIAGELHVPAKLTLGSGLVMLQPLWLMADSNHWPLQPLM
jgi:hypothetical protein